MIERYADLHGAPQDLAYWVAQCESEFLNVPNRNGGTYGKGIYQFVQNTWDGNCEGDIWDVEDNVNCGTRLLSYGHTWHWGTSTTEWGTYWCWAPKVGML